MIERVIADIAGRLAPSSGDSLTGFVIDADHFLGASEALQSVTVKRSTSPSSLIEVRADAARSIETVQELSRALTEAWQALSYPHFQASAVHFYKQATVLRFVTVISGDRFYVSGTVRVAGPHYPNLVQRYERDFGRTRSPLSNLGT